MSNYKAYTKHPYTKEFEMATWLDNHYGGRQYGVRFDNGDTFKPDNLEVKSFDERMYEYYCEWYKTNEAKIGENDIPEKALTALGGAYQKLRESYNF